MERSQTTYEQFREMQLANTLYEGYELLTAKRDSIVHGPSYTIYSQFGEKVTFIESLFTPQDSIMLFASDTQDILVGYRQSDIARTDAAISAKGQIVTSKKGFATSIELAHFDVLQNLADSDPLHRNVIYTVKDWNDAALESIGEKYKGNNDLLAGKDKERKRWLAEYGPRGKLGFNNQGERIFVSSEETVVMPLENIDKITLQRKDILLWGERNIVLPLRHYVLPIEDKEKVQLRKHNMFMHTIFPQVEHMVTNSRRYWRF